MNGWHWNLPSILNDVEYLVVDTVGASPYICAQLQNKLHLVIEDQNNLDRQSN
jgi:hypothetical protein